MLKCLFLNGERFRLFKNMKKLYLPIIIIILIVIGAVFYFSSPEPKIYPNEAALIINFGETKRAFAGETIEGMTALDALLVSAEAGEFEFDFKDNFLKRINHFEEGDKKWNVYFNEEKTEDSLSQILIKPKDKIELRFE